MTSWTAAQQQNAATIVQVGQQLGASPRDIQIALMTAMQESGLTNINYGDAAGPDSLGLFQQRAPWGSAAARMDPAESARMFFEGGQTGEPGLFSFKNRDSMSLTQAAQAVQVSAFPDAYAKWSTDAASLMGNPSLATAGGGGPTTSSPTNTFLGTQNSTQNLGAQQAASDATSAQVAKLTASNPTGMPTLGQAEKPLVDTLKTVAEEEKPIAGGNDPTAQAAAGGQTFLPQLSHADFTSQMSGTPLPGSTALSNTPGASGTGPAATILQKALSQVGTPYVWGGSAPGGFDCSGLVQWAYAQAGITLPRISYAQATSGPKVGLNQLQPGDLVGFDEYNRNGAGNADHIAIYLGNNQIIEAPHTGADVRVRTLSSWDQANAWGVNMSGFFSGGSTPAAPVGNAR